MIPSVFPLPVQLLGFGFNATVIDISLPRLRELEHCYGGALETRASSRYEIAEELATADLAVGSVLIPGAAAASS